MSGASETPTADVAVPQISEEDQAVQILVNLAARRQRSRVLSENELRLISDLLQNFIDSATLRTAPTKSQMLVAVSALLQKPGNVSSKWSKPQLAEVLMRWTKEAMSLSPPSQQSKLFVELKSFKGKRKNVDLSTAIFIEDDDGSVATFSISSPSSNQRISTPLNLSQRRVDFDLVDGLSAISRPPVTPNSISTSASSFARRLDQVASFSELAANSPEDPGVPAFDGETARLANPALADNGAMIFPPSPVGAFNQLMISILTKFPRKQALALQLTLKGSPTRAMMNAWKTSFASIILKSMRLPRRTSLALCHEKLKHLQTKASYEIRLFLYMPELQQFWRH